MRVEFGRRLLFHAALLAALTVAFSAFGAAPEPRPALKKMLGQVKSQVSAVSLNEAQALMAGQSVLFVDVRTDAEYAAGHLPGAKHLNRGKLEFMVEKAVPDKATPIIVYCKSGDRGAFSARTLMDMGYTNVRNMEGGFVGWAKAGFTVSK